MAHRSSARRASGAHSAPRRRHGARRVGRRRGPSTVLCGLVVAVLALGPEPVVGVLVDDGAPVEADGRNILAERLAESSGHGTAEPSDGPAEDPADVPVVEEPVVEESVELDGPEQEVLPGQSETGDPSPGESGTGPGGAPSAPGDPVVSDPVLPGTGWTLVWSDEFNGSAVDTSVWTVLDNSTYGAGNDEVACLMSRPENVIVSGGTLQLTARREAAPIMCEGQNSRSYTSGHLNTKGKLSFTYGRFEVRAKVPTAPGQSKGLWPAFWMRPAAGSLGEIDIMEQVGTGPTETARSGWVSQTLWYDYVGTYPKQNYVHKLPQPIDGGFHTYAVEWEAGQIRWYVDDVETYQVSSSEVPWIDGTFDQPFYLRLNLAVGGRWPGDPTAETLLPATYEIDYVRIYQR